ncbi:MAG: hypothetical protein E7208_05570 [Clostridium butyricum]|nr:hypothetical protein [Clostridium butyricum]
MNNNNFFQPIMLERQRIGLMLESLYKFPLSIVTAALGYGKTTVIKEFFQNHKEVSLFWCTFGKNEVNEIQLWKRITMFFSKQENNMIKSIANLEFPRTEGKRKNIVSMLKKYIKKDSFFILDNYHECISKDLDELIKEIVYANIPNFHIIIIGRTYPKLPYEEMILKKLCLIINQKDLALTESETQEFFLINGICLTENELKKIYMYTEGWISAIYLILLDYLKNGKSDMEVLTNLLKTIVFDKLSENEQKLIVMMSTFDTFTAKQAIFISQLEDSENILSKINNNLVKYDHFNKTYKMNDLLKIVAQDELLNRGYSEIELIYLCGEWYESQEKFISACKYYIESNKIDSVFKVLEKNDCLKMYKLAPITFIKFFEKLKFEEKLAHMKVYIIFIYSYIVFEDIEKGRSLIKEIIEYDYSNLSEEQLVELKKWYGEIKFLKSIASFNNLKIMNREIKEAYEIFNRTPSKVLSSFYTNIGTIVIQCMAYYNEAGKFKEIIKLEKEYIKYYLLIVKGKDAGWKMLIQAEYEFFIGNLEKAKEYADIASKKALFKKNYYVAIDSYFIKMRCNIYFGEKDELYNNFESLKEMIQCIPKNSILIINYDLITGYIHSCLGEKNKIAKWLLNYDFEHTLHLQFFKLMKSEWLTYGKILICEKRYIELEALSEDMIEKSSEGTYLFIILYGKIYNAISSKHLYGKEEAIYKLKKAIKIAMQDDIVIPFIENSSEIIELLKAIENENPFVKKLIIYCERYAKSIQAFNEDEKSVKLLSKREIEILKLAELGLKNAEIANKLYIAKVTVEKTLSSSYKKLNVSNRIEAINKLRNSL